MDTPNFQTFYQENFGPLYHYVYSKIRQREEAEDLTSQIFMKAMRGLDFHHNAYSRRTWLFQVARTTIADHWRSYYHKATVSLDGLLEAGWEGPVEEELSLVSSKAEESVQNILQILSERDQEVLTARFLLNLSVREAAAKMGITETNLKVVQFRALKRAALKASSHGLSPLRVREMAAKD